MSMTESDLSMLASCINQDPFTEEQSEFLSKWWMVTSDAQVDSLNEELPSNFKIAALETNEGTKVLPSFIITDQELYAPIIDELQELEMIELSPADFPQLFPTGESEE